MINRLSIKNFQSHKNTKLNFDPGVNVIIGPTDAGKSAIFRALMWVLYNRPLGDAFRSNWGGDTLAQIEFDNNILQRFKSKSYNHYDLNSDIYKAFGQEPPEEILKAHNIDRGLNIQTQIDPFFLLQSSSGEVARYFNQIAKLDDIDKVSKGVNQELKNANQDLVRAEHYISELESELEQYNHLDDISGMIEQTESLKEQINLKKQKKRNYQDQVENIEQLEEDIKEKKNKLQVKPKVLEAIDILDKINNKKDIKKQLQGLLDRINRQQIKINKKEEKLNKNKEKFHKEMPNICPLCNQAVKD